MQPNAKVYVVFLSKINLKPLVDIYLKNVTQIKLKIKICLIYNSITITTYIPLQSWCLLCKLCRTCQCGSQQVESCWYLHWYWWPWTHQAVVSCQQGGIVEPQKSNPSPPSFCLYEPSTHAAVLSALSSMYHHMFMHRQFLSLVF